jgi:hypothetical protein
MPCCTVGPFSLLRFALLFSSFGVSAEDRNATATRTEAAVSQGSLVVAVAAVAAVVAILVVVGRGCKGDSKE